ncbi:MAG: UvrB/UvrC motif-containing protein [Clostridia bacterium]|nr:UvrB/UvrC motif-containing protein [Clostridia bacterium]
MLCEKCGVNLASLHLSQNINGKKTELHVCANCAAQMGYLGVKDIFSTDFFNLLTPNISGYARCPGCGETYEEYKATKRIGCEKCYAHFASFLEPVLKKVHGSALHTGKLPKKAGGALRQKREIERLRRNLQEAILNEEFEKAASLRDRLHEIEGSDGK